MFLEKRRTRVKKTAKIADGSPKKLAAKKTGGDETAEITSNSVKKPVSNPSIDNS